MEFETLNTPNAVAYVTEKFVGMGVSNLQITSSEEFLEDAYPVIKLWFIAGEMLYAGEFWLETRGDGSKFLYGEW